MLGKYLSDTPAVVDFDTVTTPNEYFESLLSGDFFGASRFNPGTQKAKGVFFLQNKLKSLQNTLYYWNVPKHLLFKAGTSFDDSSFNYPVFARPCPVNPRHGFVDSTLCNNAEEVNQVSAAAYAAEKDAEILITKPVDSHYNAIINGGIITFAKGNDGATSGKGVNYFYISEDPLSEMLGLNEKKVINSEEIPFYEFVFGPAGSTRVTNLVQVRSAPKTPRVKDFVPAPVVVKNILKATGDLLDWESLLKTVDPTTTIVDHTDGSLSSHYAIHAIVNKVPIFTTYVPELGSVVEPTVEDPTITEDDRQKFIQSFAGGFSSGTYLLDNNKYIGNSSTSIDGLMGNIIRIALGTLHNYSSIALSKDYQLLGMVLGLFCRTAFAVSVGETRYNRKRAEKMIFSSQYYSKLPQGGRSLCYYHLFSLAATDSQNMAASAYHIFDRMTWDSSYGGKKWASCTRSAINLFNACVVGDISKVVELLNVVINENHNGGKYLNKVVGYSDFDEAANNSSVYVLKNLHNIVDILDTAWTYAKSVDLSAKASELKVLDLTWVTPIKAPEVLKNVWIPATSNEFLDTVIVNWAGVMHTVVLPNKVKNPYSSECMCDTCHPSQKIKVISPPFWISLGDGTKVISKSMLNKLLEKQGVVGVELS
jgi:hypothetical protein